MDTHPRPSISPTCFRLLSRPATPMMQQYHEAKSVAGEALLLFRMGDFYELFFEDAQRAAELLGLALTSREKGENPIPMAGFPHHQLDGYLAKIIAAGHRAAVCEQVEEARHAKGLVRREVTRIVTPGTVTDDALLNPAASNFLAAVVADDKAQAIGMAWIDLSTGSFEATAQSSDAFPDELARIAPAELLMADGAELAPGLLACTVTTRPEWEFGLQQAQQALTSHFGTQSLEGFGFEDDSANDRLGMRAAGAVIQYLSETQKASLAHIDRLKRHEVNNTLQIDPATRRSLEISQTLRTGQRGGSLLDVIDRTVTAMGARLLADWLAAPLAQREPIVERHEAVAEFVGQQSLTAELRESLRKIYDIERLLARVTTGRASPRDLQHVGSTLSCLPRVKAKLTGRQSARLAALEGQIDLCPDIRGPLEHGLVDDCPLASREGGIIRSGYNAELDDLRKLQAGGKQWMANYQAEQIERTGIPNLKVGFNKVFGYYLEVTHTHREKIPEDFIRKQTLKNAERYITSELKDYEERVLSADERAKDLEYELFVQLREQVAQSASRLRSTAAALAEIDVFASLADLARARGYVQPTMVEEPALIVEQGRHPVLDITEPDGTFVPNDIQVAARHFHAPRGTDHASILLITGPNMAGKSTYIRQTAQISLLAQIGSFVPAQAATIGVADRIFARVGASDELSRGQSTFMVEMTETARILNTATAKSLVILDEIGRGTSTYDGLSLAWSIVEHLHEQIGCRTLFATHYHELTDLEAKLPGVKNYNVAVKEWDDHIVFLHQVVAGAADKSYGIHVAQLAGVPGEVNERARQVLKWLEGRGTERDGRLVKTKQKAKGQLTFFEANDHPLLAEIRNADVNGLTPLRALQLVAEWQERLQEKNQQ